MGKKFKNIEARTNGFTPASILGMEGDVCVRVTNQEDFMLAFSTNENRLKVHYAPYKILSELEAVVLKGYLENYTVSDSILVTYRKKDVFGDVIFNFQSFNYEEKSNTMVIDYTYEGSVS